MDKCILIKPDISFKNDIQAFRQEMLNDESSKYETGPFKRMDNIEEWLEFNKKCENKETVPENWVTYEQYIYVREMDNKIVGMIQFRHYLNEYLEKYVGHIGYSVRPNERRKGYAKMMLADCLSICKLKGLEKILIMCIEENEASRRTILANGGVYESTILSESNGLHLERYWMHL